MKKILLFMMALVMSISVFAAKGVVTADTFITLSKEDNVKLLEFLSKNDEKGFNDLWQALAKADKAGVATKDAPIEILENDGLVVKFTSPDLKTPAYIPAVIVKEVK